MHIVRLAGAMLNEGGVGVSSSDMLMAEERRGEERGGVETRPHHYPATKVPSTDNGTLCQATKEC